MSAAGELSAPVFNLQTERNVYVAAGVLVHNCHLFAAGSFFSAIDPWPARYRIGVSDDERRRDRKEFLIHDLFGPEPLAEVSYEEIVEKGHALDVEVRVVVSDFDAPWYGDVAASDPLDEGAKVDDEREDVGYNRLLDEMGADEARNALVARCAREELAAGEQVVVLAHRREHCRAVERVLITQGCPTGYLIGGLDYREQFERARLRLEAGERIAALGTYKSLSTGLDLPAVAAGVCATPVASKGQFRQVRGRVCRKPDGKSSARLYYVLDANVFGMTPLRRMMKWARVVLVRVGDAWVPAREYLRSGGGTAATAARHTLFDGIDDGGG